MAVTWKTHKINGFSASLFFFFSEFVFHAYVTIDKEAVMLQSIICITGWCNACLLGCCMYNMWVLVNGVGNIVHNTANWPLPLALCLFGRDPQICLMTGEGPRNLIVTNCCIKELELYQWRVPVNYHSWCFHPVAKHLSTLSLWISL